MLEVRNVSFKYIEDEVVKDISFAAEKGEYIAIIGESGCGKSTLLEIIYGLLHIEKGAVLWNKEKLLGPNHYLIPGEPFIKYLSQDFDLMPFTSVAENIGKFLSNRYPKKKKRRTQELLELVDMSAFSDEKVKNLSGGQKQRVAIARVLAKEPDLLLLDEPFSHIDNFRKTHLRRKIFRYLKENNITCVVATHDSTDALSFADKVLVMQDGKLVAKNTPEYLYQNPNSKYVGSFFGDINEIELQKINTSTSNEKVLLYPQDIKIDNSSRCKGIVQKSYFMEGLYLIEILFKEEIIFVQHHKSIESNLQVGLIFLTLRSI